MEETHFFWQRQLAAKQLLAGEKGRKTQKLTLSPFWMGPTWVVPGRSLTVFGHSGHDLDSKYDRARVPPYNRHDLRPALVVQKPLMFPPL